MSNCKVLIEDMINDYGKYIYNYAIKLCCNYADAEEITQETFIKGWQSYGSLKDKTAVKSWLRTICLNEFRMKLRKNKNEKLIEDINDLEKDGELYKEYIPRPEDEVTVEETIRDLQNGCFLAMVRKLTLNQRIAFSLVDMFGLEREEVAEILGVSPKALKGLLYRARMNLESFFADHCNLLDEKNPCSCKAWINFVGNREEMQKRVREKKLDYKKTDYKLNKEVRSKVLYLYKNMPEKKPPKSWYDNVIKIASEL